MHRPRLLGISWARYSASGEELAFHEQEHQVATWDAIDSTLDAIDEADAAISVLFVKLDTHVLEVDGEAWGGCDRVDL